jgi:predicted Zn finger-like uncharacterized protein
MRLICPKCDAQYNVADDAIPEGGRDVQCSSCAHTWFQTDAPAVAGRNTSKVLSRVLPNAVKKSASHDVGAYDTPTNSKPISQKPMHRPVDPTVANILREEAARDHAVSDSGAWEPPETQEAKLAAEKNIAETRKRIAQMTESEGGTRSPSATAAGAGGVAGAAVVTANPRAVPGIHEINAALRARAEASDSSGLNEAEKNEAVRRSGFRRGFFFVLILMAILILPYIYATQITESLPQTRVIMEPYIAVVDQLRVSVDALFGTLTEMVERFRG